MCRGDLNCYRALSTNLVCRMEPEVNELIMDSLNINYIDESEYPSTTDIQNRCCSFWDQCLTCCYHLFGSEALGLRSIEPTPAELCVLDPVLTVQPAVQLCGHAVRLVSR